MVEYDFLLQKSNSFYIIYLILFSLKERNSYSHYLILKIKSVDGFKTVFQKRKEKELISEILSGGF